MFVGSAFGPGGLRSRIKHHTQPVRSAHWHIDYLRQAANVIDIWHSADDESRQFSSKIEHSLTRRSTNQTIRAAPIVCL